MLAVYLIAGTACYRPAGDTTADSADKIKAAPPVTGDSTPMANAQITLRTDKSVYKAADPVTLTIVNGTSSKYYFNPCTRVLERESGSAWTEVREERMCTMIAHVLDAKSTRTEQTELSDGLAPGRYRVVVAFTEDNASGGGEGRTVRATAAIQIR